MELGKDIEDSVIEDKISAQKPNQCATLIYTVRATWKLTFPYTLYVHMNFFPVVWHHWKPQRSDAQP